MSFIGNVPAESYTTVVKDTFSGNDSTTDFTLSIPATTNSVEVFVENVQQEPTDAYTIAGTTLSFTAAPVTGTDNIYVIHRGPAVQQVVPPAGVALSPSTVTATGDISTEGDLKVEVSSGGIYTITGTDTVSNRTLTLPDEAGTVATTNGITMADFWRKETQTAGDEVIDDVEQVDSASFANLGSSMTESSGVFTFPETGLYQVIAHALFARGNPGASDNCQIFIEVSSDGGSNFSNAGRARASIPEAGKMSTGSISCFVNVTDVSNIKVRFSQAFEDQTNLINGNSNENRTVFSFIRIGDSQ